MKNIIFLVLILIITSCTTPKTIIIDKCETFKPDSINIREIGLKDAYEAFGYPDTLLVVK